MMEQWIWGYTIFRQIHVSQQEVGYLKDIYGYIGYIGYMYINVFYNIYLVLRKIRGVSMRVCVYVYIYIRICRYMYIHII